MTARNEKPSPSESSTDGIIQGLNIVANLLDKYDETGVEATVVREAAGRLDLLADQRDELLAALKACLESSLNGGLVHEQVSAFKRAIKNAEAAL